MHEPRVCGSWRSPRRSPRERRPCTPVVLSLPGLGASARRHATCCGGQRESLGGRSGDRRSRDRRRDRCWSRQTDAREQRRGAPEAGDARGRSPASSCACCGGWPRPASGAPSWSPVAARRRSRPRRGRVVRRGSSSCSSTTTAGSGRTASPSWRRATRSDGAPFVLTMADHLYSPLVIEALRTIRARDVDVALAVDRRLDEIGDIDDATRVRTGAGGPHRRDRQGAPCLRRDRHRGLPLHAGALRRDRGRARRARRLLAEPRRRTGRAARPGARGGHSEGGLVAGRGQRGRPRPRRAQACCGTRPSRSTWPPRPRWRDEHDRALQYRGRAPRLRRGRGGERLRGRLCRAAPGPSRRPRADAGARPLGPPGAVELGPAGQLRPHAVQGQRGAVPRASPAGCRR